jgi:thioredoxin-related protein
MSNNKKNLGTVGIVTHKIENVEYVFQFNNDEPINISSSSLIGRDSKELSLSIKVTSNSNIVFYDGKGNTFKIFAREKSND